MSSFNLPNFGSRPILDGGGHSVGRISADGGIELGEIHGRLNFDGRVLRADREIGGAGFMGLRIQGLGPYQRIVEGLDGNFHIQ